VRPALEGTRNVLDAVDRVESIGRVVITSSAAAVYGDCTEIRSLPGQTFSEDVWNTTSSVDHMPYNYSKTVAEREAWARADAQTRWSLVAVNPTMVFGPPLSDRKDSTSGDTIERFVDGRLRFGAPGLHFGIVDVRDVAIAHLLAAAKPEASGRHVLAADVLSMMDVGRSLARSFGQRYPLPRFEAPKALVYLAAPFEGLSWRFVRHNIGVPIRFDTARSRDLGVEYRPVDDTLREHVEAMQRFGWIEA
jgi:nucleoside-diphosphate-sugar epimerase